MGRPYARSAVAALAIAAMLGGAALVRGSWPSAPVEERAAMASSEPATFPSNANVSTRALTTTSPSSSAPTVSREPSDSTEEELIERLRAADPPTVVHLSREMRKQYPKGRFADERDAREVDALLALGQLREAHYRAQLFVQHYPDSPFAQRVVNLMGVHPRPPGVVPEPPDDKESSR